MPNFVDIIVVICEMEEDARKRLSKIARKIELRIAYKTKMLNKDWEH